MSALARRRLVILGRGVAVVFALFFGIGMIGNLSGNAVDPASGFGMLVRWGTGGEPQEVMLGAIYLALAAFLWKAVADPEQHWLYVDFAVAANAAHSMVMVLLSVVWPHSLQHLCGDSLLTVIPTAFAGLGVAAGAAHASGSPDSRLSYADGPKEGDVGAQGQLRPAVGCRAARARAGVRPAIALHAERRRAVVAVHARVDARRAGASEARVAEAARGLVTFAALVGRGSPR